MVIGRIVISDVEPVIDCGRRPAKAVPGETFEVSATVFREGHEVPGAGVVLRGPDGRRLLMARMRETAPGLDPYAAGRHLRAESGDHTTRNELVQSGLDGAAGHPQAPRRFEHSHPGLGRE